jgi:hypothetical protein
MEGGTSLIADLDSASKRLLAKGKDATDHHLGVVITI